MCHSGEPFRFLLSRHHCRSNFLEDYAFTPVPLPLESAFHMLLFFPYLLLLWEVFSVHSWSSCWGPEPDLFILLWSVSSNSMSGTGCSSSGFVLLLSFIPSGIFSASFLFDSEDLHTEKGFQGGIDRCHEYKEGQILAECPLVVVTCVHVAVFQLELQVYNCRYIDNSQEECSYHVCDA